MSDPGDTHSNEALHDHDNRRGSRLHDDDELRNDFDNDRALDSDPTAEGKSVLIKNLKFETSPARVRKIFEKYGAVRDVYIPLDYFSKRPRGFAFVEFFSADDASVAVKHLHKTMVDGNEVTVLLAQDRRKTPDVMRSLCTQRSRPRDGHRGDRYNDRDRGDRYNDRDRDTDHRSSYQQHRRDPYHSSSGEYRSRDDRRDRGSGYDGYDRHGVRESSRRRSRSNRRSFDDDARRPYEEYSRSYSRRSRSPDRSVHD